MTDRTVDELARRLAAPMPRRRVLRLLGAALALAALPSVRAAKAGAAGPRPNKRVSHCCNGQCVQLQFDAANCGSCGLVCPPGHACSAGNCVPA